MVRDHRMQVTRLAGREPASLLGSYVADSAWEPGDVTHIGRRRYRVVSVRLLGERLDVGRQYWAVEVVRSDLSAH